MTAAPEAPRGTPSPTARRLTVAAVLLALLGVCATMKTQFAQEVESAGLPAGPGAQAPVTESDVASLPEPARRYLKFMGVIGRPRDWSFRMHATARFKRALGESWRAAETWQYNSALDVARIYHMKLRFYGVPVIGRDIYLHGRGQLVIRPLDLVTVESDSGPAFDMGELATWLNDAILFAPSMLLGPNTSWTEAGSDAFDITLRDAGHLVTARVTVSASGAPLDFETDARSLRDPATGALRRARWSTTVHGWQTVNGRTLPTGGQAIWHLPDGDFPYAELMVRPSDVEFNVAPAS